MTAREFIFVSFEVRQQYAIEWRAIDKRYPLLSAPPDGVELHEHWAILADLRAAARDELRRAIRAAAKQAALQGLEGKYPIAV